MNSSENMSVTKLTAEVHFAQRLAGNEKNTRDKTIKKLKLWMTVRSKSGKNVFTEEDLMKLWKGLFYCMWMCDKPVVQEELADNIAKLVHHLHTTESALLYFKTFLQTMEREWHGIDRLRMDKFYMFIRRVFCEQLEVLKKHEWNEEYVTAFVDVLKRGPLNAAQPTKANGLLHHIADIYLDELTRVGATQLSPQETLIFLDPFCIFVAETKNKSMMKSLLREIFEDIVVQSKIGMEEVIEADKAMRKKRRKEEKDDNEESDEESDEEDPTLAFDYSAIADRLFTLASRKQTPGLNRKRIYDVVKRFQDLAKGIYPIQDLEEMAQISSDDEIEDDVKLKYKKKMKKRMREAKMNKEKEMDDGEEMSGEPRKKKKKGSSEKIDKEESQNTMLLNGDVRNKTKNKLTKRKKEEKLEDVVDAIEMDTSRSTQSNKMKKKKKKKKNNEQLKLKEKSTEENKVQIVIVGDTSKTNDTTVNDTKQECGKEKMKHSESIVERVKKAAKRRTCIGNNEEKPEEVFASFQAVSTPSAVAIRKRVKVSQTEPRKAKKSVLNAPGSSPSPTKKHVKIALSKNLNHPQSDYRRQVIGSPGIPFDSDKKPLHSVLKRTPPSVPVGKIKKTRMMTRRSTAADFF